MRTSAWKIMIFMLLVFMLAALIVARADQAACTGEVTITYEEDETVLAAVAPDPPDDDVTDEPAEEEPEVPKENIDIELIADYSEKEKTPKLLESVPLDANTQWTIFGLCDQDCSLFAAVMAISYKESRFIANVIGDDGRCIGMMQINYAFHANRMRALGVTDLLDPIGNVTVAISYIKDLQREFYVGPDSHVLYVAYNMGPTGARELFDRGVYSTSYSWDVSSYYEAYMRELGNGSLM